TSTNSSSQQLMNFGPALVAGATGATGATRDLSPTVLGSDVVIKDLSCHIAWQPFGPNVGTPGRAALTCRDNWYGDRISMCAPFSTTPVVKSRTGFRQRMITMYRNGAVYKGSRKCVDAVEDVEHCFLWTGNVAISIGTVCDVATTSTSP